MSCQKLFLKLANPDYSGVSRIIFTDEFIGEYSNLVTTNGGGWSRMDSKNILTNTYNFVSVKKNIIRFSIGIDDHEKELIKNDIDDSDEIIRKRKETNSNKIIAYKLVGFRKDNAFSRSISKNIREHFKDSRCVILFTSDIEIDHKNGRYNNPRVNNVKTQTIEDFQALSKSANNAKRQHCKDCKNTGNRFDAKQLGYKMSFSYGSRKYIESVNGCVGCYWYDIHAFNSNKDIEDLCKSVEKL